MMSSPADRLRDALTVISRSVGNASIPWLVGGSTGLLLQGIPLDRAPRDLDIYVDAKYAVQMHAALKAYATDQQITSQTGIYRSILSHYEISGIKAELVGGFEVRTMGSVYDVEAAFLYEQAASYRWTAPDDGGPMEIRLMPLIHELIFNVLRERPDRYEAIGAFCREVHRMNHEKLLETLLRRNRISPEVTKRLWQLLLQEGV